MNVLVINAGSSSLKYQMFDMATQTVMAKGLCERIGIDGRYKYEAGGNKLEGETPMETHADAIRFLTKMLVDADHGVIKSMKEIDAVGHRVLHGGQKFSGSVLVNDQVIEAVKECIPLGPLHNPANLTGIAACEEVMPGVPQVAVFDTAFHAKMPAVAYMYAIPYEYYEKYGLRKYGFHGTSHRFVSAQAAEMLGMGDEARIITCHLGNGSSIAAVHGGHSVDTSMGLTPLEGLPMGTRSGNIDPTVVEFLVNNEKMTAPEVLTMLNKKSGVLGVSGVSSDFRDLGAAADSGNERAKLAKEMFIYSVKKYIGSYAAAMGGVDAIVFTGGVGENSSDIRAACVSGLEFMGVKMDESKNNGARGVKCDVSAADSKTKILVIPTNEELVIAMDTVEIVEGK